MLSVLVQIWGPVDSISCAYDWITTGIIKNPESLDIGKLRIAAINIINGMEYKPLTNAVRLNVVRDEKTEMKVTLMDLW